MDLFINGINYGESGGIASSSSFDDLPFPDDPSSSGVPAGLGSTQNAVSAPPHVSTLQHFWDVIKQDASSAVDHAEAGVKSVYTGTKHVIGTVYEDAASGVSTVVGDVANPIGNTLKSTYLYLLLGIVVIAGAIYFIGKGGAVKVGV